MISLHTVNAMQSIQSMLFQMGKYSIVHLKRTMTLPECTDIFTVISPKEQYQEPQKFQILFIFSKLTATRSIRKDKHMPANSFV